MESQGQNGSGSYARALVDIRAVIQKERISWGNRLNMMELGRDTNEYSALVGYWYDRLYEIEEEIDDEIKRTAADVPIVERMMAVKGVGPILAVKIAAMIDIRRADTVSALWRYAGYGVAEDGKRDRPIKGQKLVYNKRLKTACRLVAKSFLLSGSPYRRIYDDARAYYDRNRPDWTDGHRHNAAIRKMIKVWLQHVWVVWRKLEGLPVSQPYIMASATPHRYYSPEEFGWERLEASHES